MANRMITPKDGILLLDIALIRLQLSMPLITTRMACADERLMSSLLAGASDFVALACIMIGSRNAYRQERSIMPLDLLSNPQARSLLAADSLAESPIDLHRRMPGYAPTPLSSAPHIAALVGVAEVWVKREACRMDMPAFKILGASWATYRALERMRGRPFDSWQTITDLREQVATLRPLTLVAATDGNHGRAVARMARLLGLDSEIYVPHGTAAARIRAIESEGAALTIFEGSYDDAVAYAATRASTERLVISDTAWEGYQRVPHDVITGYQTIFEETDAQLHDQGGAPPDLVMIQMGVGALAAATVRHYRAANRQLQPRVVGVEPDTAACVLAAARAGRIVEVPGPHPSIMAGLNAGLASPLALPDLLAGIDLFMAIPDHLAEQAMQALAHDGITAGETGAAGVAGLIALMQDSQTSTARAALGLSVHSRVLVVVSEGATDPENYQRVVGQPPHWFCGRVSGCSCRGEE